MSTGGRKTARSRPRSQSDRLTRPIPSRHEKTTVLIIGEGQQTEPNYLRGLRQAEFVSENFSLIVKKGNGGKREDIVADAVEHKEVAERRGEGFDEVWCIIDVESASEHASVVAAAKLARQHKITMCWSNPCFEIWLLSHFRRQGRSYADCDKVEVALTKEWRKLCERDYEKNDEYVYNRVAHLTGTAIDNARWVRETHHKDVSETFDANSSTDAYKLVGMLVGGAS